ncbi:MAG: MFS transporter [Chloroflexi bacterium]|nr:MFS transporter [Chloroflexota bacterium]
MSAEPSRRRFRYFYGWNIVAVAAIAQLAGTASNNTMLGIFMPAMEQDLGVSRAAISGISTVARLVESFIAPLVGILLDRGWHKWLVVGGALLAGIGFALPGTSDELWQIYVLRGLVVGIGVAGFGRLVMSVTISNWFIAKRGRAMGISAIGGSGGALLLAPLSAWMLTTLGWRWGWAILGLMIWLLVLVPGALFMVRRPEDVGLTPDGAPPPSASPPPSPSASPQPSPSPSPPPSPSNEGPPGGASQPPAVLTEEDSWTLHDALRTRAFWLLIVALGVGELAQQAVNLHLFPYLYDLGYSPLVGASIITLRGVISVTSAPLWGLLSEQVPPRGLLIATFAQYAFGIYMLLQADSLAGVFLAVGIYGLALSGTNVIAEVAWAEYFGRRSLGAIRGASMPVSVLLTAFGPLAAGLLYTATGSYSLAFHGIVAASALSAVLTFACTRPIRRKVAPPMTRPDL